MYAHPGRGRLRRRHGNPRGRPGGRLRDAPAGGHGLRRVGLHFEVFDPRGPGPQGGRPVHRPRAAHGAAPGALFPPLCGEGDRLVAGKRGARRGGAADARRLHPARRRVLPVHHRPALRPPPAGGGQRACPHHRAGEPGLCGHDPGRPGPIRRLGGVRREPALPGAGEPGVPPPGSGHRGGLVQRRLLVCRRVPGPPGGRGGAEPPLRPGRPGDRGAACPPGRWKTGCSPWRGG